MVYFCHQNQNVKMLVILRLLKPHKIGTHLKGIETCFQVVQLFMKSLHFWVSYITFYDFLKIPSFVKWLKKVIFNHLSKLPYFGVVIFTSSVRNPGA
jgi:hypothetical protein